MEAYNLSPEEISSTQEMIEHQGEVLEPAHVNIFLHRALLQEIDQRSRKPGWARSPEIPINREQIELSANADVVVFQEHQQEGGTEYWLTRAKIGESFADPGRQLLQVLAATEMPIAYKHSDSSVTLHPAFEELFSADESFLPMPTQDQLSAIVSAGDQYPIGVDIKDCPRAYVDSVGARAIKNNNE